MPSATQTVAAEFSHVNAITTLLATESLLFAAYSLAVNLSGSTDRVRGWLIPGKVLALIAVFALAFIALGAGMAWHAVFVAHGFPNDWPDRIIASSLLMAITIQPLLAGLLAFGLRKTE